MAEEILATFLAIVREEGHSLTPAKGKAVQRSCQVYMDRAQRDSVLMAQMHRFSHDEAGEREMAVQFAGVVRRIGD